MSKSETHTIDMEQAQLMFIENVYPHSGDDMYTDFPDTLWKELEEYMENQGYELIKQNDEFVFVGE